MKIWKVAALLALAAVPFILVKRENPKPQGPVETDEIFDYELSSR